MTTLNWIYFVGGLVVVLCVLMEVRNRFVGATRRRLLKENTIEEYRKYPSYDKMMIQFWKWRY